MNKNKDLTRKIALTGIMCALALAFSYLETLIPAYPGFPPGAKPGLSNIVTMFMAGSAGPLYAFFITVIKGLFAGVTRGFTAMLMSLSGGILSTAAACLLFGVLAHTCHLTVRILHKALELILKRGVCRLAHGYVIRRLLAAALLTLRWSGAPACLTASSGFLVFFSGRRRSGGLD